MKTPTKKYNNYTIPRKIRYQIYSKALELYEKDYDAISYGMCKFINKSRAEIDRTLPDPYWDMPEYPEIYKHKPIDHSKFGEYWFDRNNKETRIKIFKQAKRETR